MDTYAYVVTQATFPTVRIAGQGIPFGILTCTTCSNTHFLNLLELGIWEVLTKEQKVQESQEGVAQNG